MDHQYKENCARNIYSIYNQMKANVECSPDQSKNCSLSILSSNRRNFEDSGKYWYLSEFDHGIAVQLYQPMLIRW